MARWTTVIVPVGFGVLLALARTRRNARRRLLEAYRVCTASSAAASIHLGDIARLVRSCFPEEFAGAEASEELARDPLGALAGFHELRDCEWLLALTIDGQLIGLAMTVAYHDSLYVASLCVAHEHRGRGVGSLLMRSASSHAASRGLPALSGSVFGGSTSLTDFYVALGGTLEVGYSLGAPGSAVVPARRLRAPSGPTTALGVPPPPPLSIRDPSREILAPCSAPERPSIA